MRRTKAMYLKIPYILALLSILNYNLCHGLLRAKLLIPQPRKVIAMHVINTKNAELINNNPASSRDDGNRNDDLCLLIDDDDCFHDIQMDYYTSQSPDYEKRWWLSLDDEQKQGTIVVDALLILLPVVIPVFAYFSYEPMAVLFDFVIDKLADRSWVSVDGRQLQTQVITPAVNGIVVPGVSILFANMISITISALRQRQLTICTALNIEANEMRSLRSLLSAFPIDDFSTAMEAQYRCQLYLAQYTTRLIAESKPGSSIIMSQFSGSMESEMNGLQEQLNIIDSTSNKAMSSSNLLSQSYSTVTRINVNRSERLSALQSTFPPLHYAILTALGLSILLCFLMETDQEILYFLSAVELRILWTILVGTFASLAVVLYDLSDPFRGSYQIRRSTDQLYSLRASFEMLCAVNDNCRTGETTK